MENGEMKRLPGHTMINCKMENGKMKSIQANTTLSGF
jgi:hypothetical protein